MTTIFQLAFPKQVTQLNGLPDTEAPLEVDGFELLFDSARSELSIKIPPADADRDAPTKLIFSTENSGGPLVRLIPIRNLLAVIQMDFSEHKFSGITLCTYS